MVYFLSCTKLCKIRAEGILRSFLPLEAPGPIKKKFIANRVTLSTSFRLLSVKVTYCLEDKIVILST